MANAYDVEIARIQLMTALVNQQTVQSQVNAALMAGLTGGGSLADLSVTPQIAEAPVQPEAPKSAPRTEAKTPAAPKGRQPKYSKLSETAYVRVSTKGLLLDDVLCFSKGDRLGDVFRALPKLNAEADAAGQPTYRVIAKDAKGKVLDVTARKVLAAKSRKA